MTKSTYSRADRVADQIRMEVADILMRKIKDPRVRSVVAYGSRFWTLEENPGQGQQGLYFYYNIISRALSAAGLDALPKHAAPGEIHWREDLVRKLIALQRPDGSWVNENNRWWENDPVLATSYSLLALEFASGLTR